MKEEYPFQKVVFLDTMTLHYIRLCLESAKKDGLEFPTDEQTVSILKNHFGKVSEKLLKESLLQGLETIVLLARDVQVEYAPVSEIEILTGITEGEARVKMAQEGIPHRIWSNFLPKEIRDRIAIEDLAAIKDRIDGLDSMLEESGVTITRSDSDRTNEVIELAKGIVGLIYMGEIDSIIYASAVAAGANYLITADSYLIETVNYIRDSKEQRYEEIRQKLNELISEVILKTEIEIKLPQAFTVTHTGRRKGLSSPSFP